MTVLRSELSMGDAERSGKESVRRLALITLALAGLIVMLAPTPLYARSMRPKPPNALVFGIFAMTAKVTTAVNVHGEHKGQILHRSWELIPTECRVNVCQRVTLYRQRSSHIIERVALRRTGTGRYAGTGMFYVGLRCRGRTYRLGSRVPFEITLTVRAVTDVGNVRFASRITATYVNRARSDDTPCPLAPSHDAARYTGSLAPPPSAPSPPSAIALTTRAESLRSSVRAL
jgi:hypothetical protein